MSVEAILKVKGRSVETIAPDSSIVLATHKLATMGIGALVVSTDGQRLAGILAERDIVRGLNKHGSKLLDLTVGDVMSRGVPVCAPDDKLTHVMAEMTRTRNRHLPVVQDGRLCGLISIGDVVKQRLEELELEGDVLRDSYRASH